MENDKWRELVKVAKEDPSLLNSINIDDLLDTLENEHVDYLENKTMASITREVYDKLSTLSFTREKLQYYCEKLIGYRLVNQIFELRLQRGVKLFKIFDEKTGQHITTPTLLAGAVMSIKFLNGGSYILFQNLAGRIFNVKFDNYIVFQRLTDEEQLILLAYDKINDESTIYDSDTCSSEEDT